MGAPLTNSLPELPSPLAAANRQAPTDRDIYFGPLQLRNGIGIDPCHVLEEMWRCGTLCDWVKASADHYARSYRGFLVGAMGIGYDPKRALLGLRFGANTKLSRNDPNADREHAEQVVLRKLQQAGYPIVTGLAIFGPVQPDTHSGLSTHTLHPCGICRQVLLEAPEITPDNLVIYTIALGPGPDNFIGERSSFTELIKLHNGHTAGL